MTSLALNSALLLVYLDSSLGRQVTDASHFGRRAGFLRASGSPRDPHETPDQPWHRCSININYGITIRIILAHHPLGTKRGGEERGDSSALERQEVRGRVGAGLPMQMPVWALGSALRSQKRPRLSSQGSSTEQLSPR